MDGNMILIIEDDADVREGVQFLFEKENFHVLAADNGEMGLALFSDEVALVILDIMMPGMSGVEVCKKIRESSVVPILFLTGKNTDTDKMKGFGAGGDDYLVKPFSHAELSARVHALIRRRTLYDQAKDISSKQESDTEWIELANLKIHKVNHIVLKDGVELELTQKEHGILCLLMSYPKKVFSSENLYESVWEEPFDAAAANTVMVHIRRLRKLVEDDPGKPQRIRTVWGKGYRFGEK